MCKKLLAVVFICTFSLANTAPPPGPPFLKCKAEDTKCITEVTQGMVPIFANGLPEYNVETLDPYHAKSVNASSGNLQFIVNDFTVTGLRDCKVIKSERVAEQSRINLDIMCTVHLEGFYILDGAVLFVPLQGNGRLIVDMKSAQFNLVIGLKNKAGEDGQNHWQVKTWSHTFDLKEKSDVVFEGLYEGNEVLGRAARALIAENGNDIIKEIGGPVIKYMISKVVKNVNHFFKAIPEEELSLN